ncbi:phenylalanine--tRNA ligase subunit beta [Frigoribacterium sp. CG_9.8]|uniref:phenylalanine--tRNA ligase subunit beta n=1 Tax=Frigoribacterium sp. CG_9.8 TaxID=2787733 RepID=UPI0018CAE16B|nr:phenylalanine--tRNA ligase subunit beta [Frigoribacterium sp. CG_9.8]MBG6108339.1 phenylalanyl-tRNA synthetase beta chain [Frigoribacterium sp. CG_9.8]
MRIPISWLREFVDVPLDVTPDDVHAALVSVGFEEEAIHTFGLSGPIVVGQVLEFTPEPQSNGKTINWCQVDVGESAPRGIVCGAHNFIVGDKVVVSLPGAILPGPFPIAARTTYGHVSDGMIASARELGLGEEHDGILRLASLGLDPAVGADATALLGLDDWAVEINVTPDRGYAFSIRGVAREYAHATGAAFRDPAERPELTQVASRVASAESAGLVARPAPSIDDRAPIRGRTGASVFVTRVVRGIDAARPSPAWMVARLSLAGIRSISLVVDITNYVMLELGQPIHGYDLDRLSGGLVVRRAEPGATLETLDGHRRTLHPQDLLITDDSGPIGLAGVMGGASTEIAATTANVLVEAANFDPVSIARTARRHKLPSEASRRFERGVDPEVADAAAARVVELLVQLADGTADTEGSRLFDVVPREPIVLPDGYIAGLMGADYSDVEILRSLTDIGGSIEPINHALSVTAPSWRPDLTDKATLAEEVARIVGYDRIPAVLPTAPPGRGLTREQRLRRSAAGLLASTGHTEVLSYPFVSQGANDTFGGPLAGAVPAIRLANPLDGEAPFLRTSLLPGLIETARRNLSRGLNDLAIYEIGSVFRPEADTRYGSGDLPSGIIRPTSSELADLLGSIPPQPLRVAALFTGAAIAKQPGQPSVPRGIADAIDAARQVGHALGVTVTVAGGSHHSFHPGRTAELFFGDHNIGFAGELLPALADERDLPRVTAVLELELGLLIELADRAVSPSAIAAYPAATQDLSVVVGADVPAGEVLSAIVEGAGPLLELAHLVDDYRGQGILDGSKSLTFALRFRANDRTLTAREATEAKLAGAARASERFGAAIRE